MLEIDRLREQIDAVDQSLIALTLDRLALCRQIAACKMAAGIPIVDPKRESDMMAKRLQGLSARDSGAVQRIMTLLLTLSKEQQAQIMEDEQQ